LNERFSEEKMRWKMEKPSFVRSEGKEEERRRAEKRKIS